MNKFIHYVHKVKYFILSFLLITGFIVIPSNLRKQMYGNVIVCIAIITFISGIVLSLDHFFTTMASDADFIEYRAYFSYADGHVFSIAFSQIVQIKVTYYRYLFYLDDGSCISLLRLSDTFIQNKSLDASIQKIFSDIIIR